MASVSITLPTSDLRRESKSYQRDKTHSTKWQYGAVAAPGKHCPHLELLLYDQACSDCAQRPFKANRGYNWESNIRRRATKESNRALHANRQALNLDVDDIRDGSDTDPVSESDEIYEVHDTSAAPCPNEAEIMYSFDAPTGPSRGENVLSYAITKAMQRFENTETEKLVRKEYDVVEDTKTVADGYEAEVDSLEYDIIDYDQLE